MNIRMKGAFALLAGLCAASEIHAQEEQQPPVTAPLPQATATLGRLGGSGVMAYVLSDDLQGLHQARIGSSRTAVRFANSLAPGAPSPQYEDKGSALVLPLTVIKALPAASGANFLRFTYAFTRGDTDRDIALENDGKISRAVVQFLRAPDPSTIFGVGLTYENSGIDNHRNIDDLNSAGRTEREAWGLQLAFGKDFAGPWAVASKVEFQKGTTNFWLDRYLTPDVHLNIDTLDQGDDRLYFETTFIGTYANLSGVPEGWLLRPSLGVTWQRNFIEEVETSLGALSSGAVGKTEDYGLLIARLSLEKATQPHPGLQVLPRIGIGLEQEYVNDLDYELSDRTYAVLSLGLGITKGGHRLGIDYTHRHGTDENRRQDSLAASLSLTF